MPSAKGVYVLNKTEENDRFEKRLKKVSKIFVRIKKSCTFAPANREASDGNREEYVHRHIGLTAYKI